MVFAFPMLEHIPNLSEALAEFCRVLKPDGLLAIGGSAASMHAYPTNSPLGEEVIHF